MTDSTNMEALVPDQRPVTLLPACGLEAHGLTDADDLLGVRRDGAVEGAIATEQCASTGLLRSLPVAQGRRGQELGRQLVQTAEERAVVARETAPDRLQAAYLCSSLHRPYASAP